MNPSHTMLTKKFSSAELLMHYQRTLNRIDFTLWRKQSILGITSCRFIIHIFATRISDRLSQHFDKNYRGLRNWLVYIFIDNRFPIAGSCNINNQKRLSRNKIRSMSCCIIQTFSMILRLKSTQLFNALCDRF